jgi:prophage tail gpP-like protein
MALAPSTASRPVAETVSLRVDGGIYQGWTSVSITRGIERASADFTLSVTRQNWRLRDDSACEVHIGNDRVITGWVDEVGKTKEGKSKAIRVPGRSRVAELVDCSAQHKSGQWNGARLERIANDLAAPYGVAVVALADTGPAFSKHRIVHGETVIACIQRLCAQRGLLCSDDAAGRLLLFTPDQASRSAPLLVGKGGNVTKIDITSRKRDRFHSYIVKGQQGGFDLDDPVLIAGPEGRATDRAVRASRTLVVIAETAVDAARCRDRAAWEAAKRAADGTRVSVTVPGWRQSPGGPLWAANTISRVTDAEEGLDADLLIAEVQFTLDENGTQTKLSLAPPAAFRLLPEQPEGNGLGAFAGLLRDNLAPR